MSNVSVESPPIRSMRQLLADQAVPEETRLRLKQTTESVEHGDQKLPLLNEGTMDELITPRSKCADGAVSDAEVAVLRHQLEFAVQQKLAAEDRVSHLDGSLKECMQQLRNLREEQEDKIHDAVAKHRREWEKLRAELEEKLEDAQHQYEEKDAENKELSESLHSESMKTARISGTHSRAETELIQLRKRLESMEKDNAVLNAQCTAMKEKQDINVQCTAMKEKQDICDKKKSSNGTYWKLPKSRTSEGLKKTTSRSGREYQSRQMPEKKVSCRSASEKAKLETGSSQHKRPSNSSRSSKDVEKTTDARLDKEYEIGGKGIDVLQERLHAMEEETKRLKELLEKKEVELQHAKLLRAEMGSKLLSSKEKQEQLLSYHGSSTNTEESLASSNGHANSSFGAADSSLVANSHCNQMIPKVNNGEISYSHIDQARFNMVSFHEQDGDFRDIEYENSSMKGTLANDMVPNLTSTIGKLVETLKDVMSLSGNVNMQDVRSIFWGSNDFHVQMRAFMNLCASSLHDKMDIMRFTNDLSLLVEELGNIEVSNGEKSKIDYEVVSLDNTRENILGDNNVNHIEKKIVTDTQDLTNTQVELRKVQKEKVSSDAHMKLEFQRRHVLEQDVGKLLGEKHELEKKLQEANAELDQLKAKVFRLEQIESNIWDEFISAKSSKHFIDEQLSGISSFTEESESQLKIIVVEWSRLQYRVGVLESEIRDKTHKNVMLEAKCQKLTDQLLRSSNFVCPNCQPVDIGGDTADQEFATKERKHWQAKLKLGTQLKALSLRKGRNRESSECSKMSMGGSSMLCEEKEQQKDKIGSLFKVRLKTVPKRLKRHQRAKIETTDSCRYGNTSDILDWELTSLSKSGRPLGEAFSEKTPEHDHYIQVVEELPSSSDEDCLSPLSVGAIVQEAEDQLPKKTRARSMDTEINDKLHNRSFSTFFSRQRKPHS